MFVPSSTNPTRPYTVNTLEAHLALQRHLYAYVFKHKEFGASKKPLTLVADDRKPAILHGQILAKHPSDVVGLSSWRSFLDLR